ncbi:MAG: polymer-forming cytoskeletal protein [Deltaproteobacteria bacterium]|nr:polymer-forming cytoskeletal protein [Deltaproteobacteria bacterium]
MLRKSKDIETSSPPPSTPVSEEKRTVIGEQISFEGGIRGKENLVVEGSVKGNIDLGNCHLTVGSKGRVEADIQAANVTVSGRLTGNIKSQDKVAFTREADFTGEVKAKRFAVEDGAYLKAVIELERDPQKKAVSTEKPAQQIASGPGKSSFTPAGKDGKEK